MLAHPTLDQLNSLGLFGLAKGFKELEHKPEARGLEHAEWLGLLLEYELMLRRQKQFETRARAARLRTRPQGVPRKPLRSLHPHAPAVRRPGDRPWRCALR